MKNSVHTINPFLIMIINDCILKAAFSQDLKKAHDILLFKKRDTAKPINQSNSITPVVSKSFEKFFSAQLYQFLFDNNILNPTQSSFRPGYSTNDALPYATKNIRFHLDKPNVGATEYLDLPKAFNSHPVLELKLRNLGFEPSATDLVNSFLENRQAANSCE